MTESKLIINYNSLVTALQNQITLIRQKAIFMTKVVAQIHWGTQSGYYNQ